MQRVVRTVILVLFFAIFVSIESLLSWLQSKITEERESKEKYRIPNIILKILRIFLLPSLAISSFSVGLPLGFHGVLSQRFDGFVEEASDYLASHIQKDKRLNHETETENEDESVEPLQEFPFYIEFDIAYSEAKEIKIPTPEEQGTYSIEIPLDLRAEKYESEKVPVNSDIHGFVVNNLYYSVDDDSVTDVSGYNYYRFADYWFYLHTVDISFTDYDGFTPDLNGATIVLQEAETKKRLCCRRIIWRDNLFSFSVQQVNT
ncbi:MAG TPA: hypothetical protein H9763_11360 [Candidatus Eisenbergiella merdigallinarum]|uniref:Uncharacterized protein n=1 Tax=Candidatus Eisenbergiella merdigallinarum TaxID=2838552 RepID=A0A9D2SDI6_9FIRM|nr:hypothetical protein [Candidatus Eisenbergiella merdigallinarum]